MMSAHPLARIVRASEDFDPGAFERRLRAGRERSPFRFPASEVPDDFRRASVLLAFWPEAERVHVLLTRRASSLRTLPGQMAFPGGRLEEGEDWIEGALREAREEVGLAPGDVEVLGMLDDAWSGARHHIVPVVGWLRARPRLVPEPLEVASIHTPTVAVLLREEAWATETVDLAGTCVHNVTIDWGEERVFGLSTDLLIEALLWGLGRPARAGEQRLENLRAWLRMQRQQETDAY